MTNRVWGGTYGNETYGQGPYGSRAFDPTLPSLSNLSPADGAEGVLATATVSFQLDSPSQFDPWSLAVKVGPDPAIAGGDFLSGYGGTLIFDGTTCTVAISTHPDWTPGPNPMSIAITDLSGNSQTFTPQFVVVTHGTLGLSETVAFSESLVLGNHPVITLSETVPFTESLNRHQASVLPIADVVSLQESLSVGEASLAWSGTQLTVVFPMGLRIDGLTDLQNYAITAMGAGTFPAGITSVTPTATTLRSGTDASIIGTHTVQILTGAFTVLDVNGYLSLQSEYNTTSYLRITSVVNSTTVTVDKPIVVDPANGSVEWSLTGPVEGVTFQTTKPTNDGQYVFTASNLLTAAGTAFSFSNGIIATATKPKVLSAVCLAEGQIQITFSDVMLEDRYLTDPQEYSVTGPTAVSVTHVTVASENSVVLHTVGMGNGSYTLTVNASGTPHDIAGNPIDPAFNTAIFTGTPPLTSRSIFTNKGPISKPPLVLQSGINANIIDATTITLPGATLSSLQLGKYLQLSGSALNAGSFIITKIVSATVARVGASFHLPDPSNGTLTWSVADPRDGQIADDPSDVTVLINSVPTTPVDVVGLLGQIVMASAPAPTDDVQVNYSWIDNPTVDVRRLNSKEFRLNSWNRDVGYVPDASRHHYRYNNTLVVPSEYVALDMQASLAQPLQRDLKYRAYERAYTALLNDPTTLTLNTPIHKIAFPPLQRTINSTFVSYGATILPEQDPVAPWTRTGNGTTSLGSDLLTVTKSITGPYPVGQVLYWDREIDLTFPHVFAATWRMYITADPTTEGVFTGIAAGYSDETRAIVVGYLDDGGIKKIGFLKAGSGNDPSAISAWTGGLDGSGNPTGAPVVFDWSTIHSFRIFRDMAGTLRLYVDGDVVETLRVTEPEVPFIEELTPPFTEVQNVFFGSMSRVAANTSVWEFFRYTILPTNPLQTAPSIFVNYEATTTPETSSQPWTPIGYAGTESILSNNYLLLDSTSATDATSEQALGLVGGDFKGYDRIEPLIARSSDVILDVGVQLRTFTHGIAPNAVMAAIDDSYRLVQLCFFPDQASPKVSYGGRSLPDAFEPYTWTPMGNQNAAMVGRTLRITDTSTTDGRIYYIDDTAPMASSDRVVSPTSDYMLEFRALVRSFTADVTTHFCGVNADVYDGIRSVGMMFTQLTGVANVTLHSEGVAIQSFPFNWNDGEAHTYRLVKSTSGNLVSLFIDSTLIGTVPYSSFMVPGGSQVGVISFGSSTPATTGSLSTVDWIYCNAWRVSTSFKKYVGVWRGFDPNSFTGYHLPLKASGPGAQVVNNALGDNAVDFIVAGVTVGDYIVIDVGPNKGAYQITGVTQHALTIASPFPSFPTVEPYRIPAETDWTAAHRYRIVRDPAGGISILLDTNAQPLMQFGYNEIDLPPSSAGVPRVINGPLSSIVFGAFDPTNLSQTSWDYVRYGATSSPSALRIVPPHQVLNQRNVMSSYERHLTNIPHTLTDFWSESEGIPPQVYPDLLENPNLVAYTLLNEGTPLVPSTQTFEVRQPVVTKVFLQTLNNIADILNNQTFVLNSSEFKMTLDVPPDVLYSSLKVIERDSGQRGIIAPFDDRMQLGTLFYQSTSCLTYDGSTLPENDPNAVTPWAFQADDSSHVTRSAFNGVLTFGTDGTGTRTIYRNSTPLPDAVGLVTQVKYRLKLLSDASFGLGDSQVRFGLSAPGMTLALGFVTSPMGERYVLVYDQNSGTVVGGRKFDFLDGNYHQYRIVRDPGALTVSIFIDS